MIKLIQDLIRIPSVSPDTGAGLSFIESTLKPFGFDCERVVFEDERGSYPVGNLYAKLQKGKGGPHLCFAGHTDVVPAGDVSSWSTDPFAATIHSGVLTGRGAADMKGAIGAFMAAAMEFAARDFEGAISFLITGDEEAEALNGTRKLVPWLQDRGEKIDACIVGEASSSEKVGDVIKIGRRGTLSGEVVVKGIQGHVAYPHLANNPIAALSKITTALQSHDFEDRDDYFEPSNLEVVYLSSGTGADNVIPEDAKLIFNVRFTPAQNAHDLQAWVQKVVADATKENGLAAEVKFRHGGDPFITEPGTFTDVVSGSIRDVTGLTPTFSTGGGTSDARFICKLCPVLELGVRNETIHKVDEQVPIQDFETLKKIYDRVLETYFM